MEPFLWIERAFERDIEFAFSTLTLQPWNLITLLFKFVFIDLCLQSVRKVDFRMHLQVSLPSVCDFAVLGNSRADFSSLLRSTERMLQLL